MTEPVYGEFPVVKRWEPVKENFPVDSLLNREFGEKGLPWTPSAAKQDRELSLCDALCPFPPASGAFRAPQGRYPRSSRLPGLENKSIHINLASYLKSGATPGP